MLSASADNARGLNRFSTKPFEKGKISSIQPELSLDSQIAGRNNPQHEFRPAANAQPYSTEQFQAYSNSKFNFGLVKSTTPELRLLPTQNQQPITQHNMFCDLIGTKPDNSLYKR